MLTDRDGDEECTPDGDDGAAHLAVGARVRVHPGTDAESCGTIVEDFGEMPGLDVRVGENQIVNRARRWAVTLDDGNLVFVDSDQIAAE